MRAGRRLGEFIRAQKETVELAKGTSGQKMTRITGGAVVELPEKDVPNLADAGTDKKRSSSAQKVSGSDKEPVTS